MDWHPRPLMPVLTVPETGTWRLDHLSGQPLTPSARSAADLDGGLVQRAEVLPVRSEVYALCTAGWLHLGGEVPDPLEVAAPRARRSRHDGVRHRVISHHPGEVLTVAGRRLTTPLTTVCDLVRYAGREGSLDLSPQRVAGLVQSLVAGGVDPAEVERRLLTDGPMRGRRLRASHTLREILTASRV
ncbi:hypothetical protein [Serinibacter salmoneus]|uniref:Transcriptional regulator with AbiEi antitoxin domain of type IV toxin-antitoxin system n=1 Tax=Serinibacter salmoneus TaxID=556530 RepID=A0A2A9CZR2_9MICO|nr:hypothetical protein [Serinibacter salmoneus]PFG19616.1 hypothetical protein ATL40_1184 [Serinibacter salmoneus]